MTIKYLLIKNRIEEELANIEKIVKKIHKVDQRIRLNNADQDFFIGDLALELHSFYTGLEKIFEDIGKTIDQSLSQSQRWHKDLLQQMTLDIQGVRPPIIQTQTYDLLMKYLEFRHLVRNLYSYHFDYQNIDHGRKRGHIITYWLSRSINL